MDCPFCKLTASEILLSNDQAIAFRDRFPISPGHTLVIPKLHVESIFTLSHFSQQSIWALVAIVRDMLRDEIKPDGFNVGVNDGPAAGQTVHHAHVHIIPRRFGDVIDPRGGIRWIIPEKAKYGD